MIASAKKFKLIVSTQLQDKVAFLHRHVGKLEWSGILIYSIINGDIEDPETLEILAEDIFLMDVGSHSYTEYDGGPEMMEIYEAHPETDPFAITPEEMAAGKRGKKFGHMHTHHDMNTYFSVTDEKELEDNGPKHNYYLSLITNFQGEYCAKIAIPTEVENNITYTYGGSDGEPVSWKANKKEEEVVTVDCDIFFEKRDFSDDVVTRIELLKKRKEKKRKKEEGERKRKFKESGKYTRAHTSPKSKKTKHISENQTTLKLGNESVSEDRLRRYLASVAMLKKDTDSTLFQALTYISKASDFNLGIWEDAVDEQLYFLFATMFPESTLKLLDIIEPCKKILANYVSSKPAKHMIEVLDSWKDVGDAEEEMIISRMGH